MSRWIITLAFVISLMLVGSIGLVGCATPQGTSSTSEFDWKGFLGDPRTWLAIIGGYAGQTPGSTLGQDMLHGFIAGDRARYGYYGYYPRSGIIHDQYGNSYSYYNWGDSGELYDQYGHSIRWDRYGTPGFYQYHFEDSFGNQWSLDEYGY